MKIAVISDIHGNLEALNGVLEDIKSEDCSKIFCLGDIVMAGPEPIETLNKVKDLMKSDDFKIIQGNTDKMLSVFSFDTYNQVVNTNAVMGSAYLADSKILSDKDKEFLKNLKEQEEINLFGIKILLVHGSPRKNNENIYPDMPLNEVEEMIKGTNADVIFCGHTHKPCGYQTNTEQTVINAGSVGRPFSESPDSCYVIMDIDEEKTTYTIKHKFVKYNVEKSAELIRKRGFDGADKLAKMLIHATSRYPE